MKIIAVIVGGIGFCMFSIAALLFVREQMFLSTAMETTGKVTGYGLAGDAGESDYCTQVEFTTNDGQVIDFEASECSASRPYEIGEQVQIFYDPQNPQKNHQIKEFSSQYLGPTLLCICSSPLLLVGILGFFMGGFQRKLQVGNIMP